MALLTGVPRCSTRVPAGPARATRGRLATLLAVLALGAIVLTAGPAAACACIVMRLTLSGEPRDAAWILPVPAQPSFALADAAVFLRDITLTGGVAPAPRLPWPSTVEQARPASRQEREHTGAAAG